MKAPDQSRIGMALALPLGGFALLLALLISATVVASGAAGCDTTTASGQGAAPTQKARDEIPPRYLRLYLTIAARYKLPWPLLAAIGAQESDHGRGPGTNEVNYAGCVGPMQIGVGGACGCFACAYGQDGDRDGRKDMLNPADAIATAANGLIKGKGARPFPDGSRENYIEAMCGYYGACADANADYANEVEAQAIAYGGERWYEPAGPFAIGPECSESVSGSADFQEAIPLTVPRAWKTTPPEVGAVVIDARIYNNAIWAAKRYGLSFSQGRGAYPPSRSHGWGVALDIVPASGSTWDRVRQFALDLGWTPECGDNGLTEREGGTCKLAPAIRFIGYDGYPNHGTGHHLHVSWRCDCGSYSGALMGPVGTVWVWPTIGFSQRSPS